MLRDVFCNVSLPDNGGTVRVELLRVPTDEDKLLCKMCAFATEGKDTDSIPTDEWLRNRMLKPRHSPIRELKFVFRFAGLPGYISTHFARHIHARPYIQSQRNDRQNKYDRRKAPQDAPVTMIWSMEAEELMIVFNKRLCAMADIATQTVVEAMRSLVLSHAPYMHGLMAPMCEYLGGICYEPRGCGKCEKA